MTINLPSIVDRNCRLGLLEMVFQVIKILKFSKRACSLTYRVKFRFDKSLRLDSLQQCIINVVSAGTKLE